MAEPQDPDFIDGKERRGKTAEQSRKDRIEKHRTEFLILYRDQKIRNMQPAHKFHRVFPNQCQQYRIQDGQQRADDPDDEKAGVKLPLRIKMIQLPPQ